jgi:catechol 2,3-dioxygenase-like lactoylglutathione lyase family enzyme
VDAPGIVSGFDHITLTVASINEAIDFYTRVLGMREASSGPGRRAVTFADKKINLNEACGVSVPRPANPAPGSADLCLTTPAPLEVLVAHLAACGAQIEHGPIRAEGASGLVTSVYIRDPDGNLIELASYDSL